MYSREAGCDELILSENLSFGTVVTPQSSGLMVVIKVMINEVNSVSYPVGALQYYFQKIEKNKGYYSLICKEIQL